MKNVTSLKASLVFKHTTQTEERHILNSTAWLTESQLMNTNPLAVTKELNSKLPRGEQIEIVWKVYKTGALV